ncbi:MAG TPA: hypothetical protein VEW07_02620 [Solirubrobacterales bacterium]|nr:hypothetical protein [Solirubrobacterales bacterium]
MNGRVPGAVRGLRESLGRSLFATTPASGSTLGRGELALVLLALLALGAVLQVFRVGPDAALNAFWAEDGQVMFQGALLGGFFDAVFTPYAGYLVFVPRLIGEVGNMVPLADAPAAVSLAAAGVVALSGLAVWYAAAGLIRNSFLRGTLVVVMVLAPVASLEAVAAASYVSWYMLFASFWLLLWRPPSSRGAALAGLFILATALSNPGVWYFLPVFALRLFAARDRRDALILGGYAIGSAIQLPVTLASSENTVEPVWTSDIWTAYLQRVVDGAALGESLGGEAWSSWGWPFLIALLVVFGTCVVAGLLRGTPSARYFAAIAIPTSLGMFVISAYQRAVGFVMTWPEGADSGLGGRYAIVPALLLVSLALVLIDQSQRPRRGPRRLPWLGIAAVVVLGVGVVTSFSIGDRAARGEPSWDAALVAAAATCPAEPPPTDPNPAAAVVSAPPGFVVYVPCDQLLSFSTDDAAR